MLKLALLFLVIAIVAGILGFVVHVAAAIAKLLFYVFLIAAAVTSLPHLLNRSKS
jgi:uncharacterized membrane protein YtjA (UPF0391 family)